jgi:hypothetical protein
MLLLGIYNILNFVNTVHYLKDVITYEELKLSSSPLLNRHANIGITLATQVVEHL